MEFQKWRGRRRRLLRADNPALPGRLPQSPAHWKRGPWQTLSWCDPRRLDCLPPAESVYPISSGSSQSETEGGAAVHPRIGPHPATVPADDPLNGRQTDTRPREFSDLVQSLKRAKQIAGVSHVEPRPVIANVKCHLTFLIHPAELDQRRVLRAGEFHRVAQ